MLQNKFLNELIQFRLNLLLESDKRYKNIFNIIKPMDNAKTFNEYFIDKINQIIEEIKENTQPEHNVRAKSLVITKLEEAELWLSKV